MDRSREIPEATAARLSRYHRVLTEHPAFLGRSGVRSADLAGAAGVDASLLRRDLSFLGTNGVRGVGYDVTTLTALITQALGAHTAHRVALFGVGHLGRALSGYAGLAGHGFELVALFDRDPGVVGSVVSGLTVKHIDVATAVLHTLDATIGVITTPVAAAQEVADLLVGAGIGSILNFAPLVLGLPEHVHLRQVDLGLELQMLAFHESRRVLEEPLAATAQVPS